MPFWQTSLYVGDLAQLSQPIRSFQNSKMFAKKCDLARFFLKISHLYYGYYFKWFFWFTISRSPTLPLTSYNNSFFIILTICTKEYYYDYIIYYSWITIIQYGTSVYSLYSHNSCRLYNIWIKVCFIYWDYFLFLIIKICAGIFSASLNFFSFTMFKYICLHHLSLLLANKD